MWARGCTVFNRSIACRFGRHHAVGAKNDFLLPRALAWRAFSASTGDADVSTKVLDTIKRYQETRKDEVSQEVAEAKDKTKLEAYLAALTKEATASSAWTDLGFDELDEVEVLLEIEEAFDHIIPDEISDQLKRVDQVIDYFKEQQTSS